MTGRGEKKITIAVLIGIGISIFSFVSARAAETETGASSSFGTGGTYLLAQDDTWDDASMDDFEFLDEEEEEQTIARVADPLRGWNEAMFVFNDKVYFWVLKPVARGYSKVMPAPAREGVKNFFHNLLMPVRFVNCVLQGKGEAASGEFGRFMLNSTVGVLGFGDPAAKYPNLNPDTEDLGQTFGRYGIGNGFYLVWPFLGPSTLRDSIGRVGDSFLDPVNYVDPPLDMYIIKGADIINATSLRIGEYEAFKDAAIDPYTASRDFYIQYRNEKVVK
jgi:phospholipid-binding lipoprotein MlaA